MIQTELFDWQRRFEQLEQGSDLLVKLNKIINWEQFRSSFETI